MWVTHVDLLSVRYSSTLVIFLQDTFHDNFVVQWHPESLRTMKISISWPRVYLIDWNRSPVSSRMPIKWARFSGLPCYRKVFPPRCTWVSFWKAYNPFKLDVWQMGNSFSGFKIRQCIFLLCFSLCFLAFRFPEHNSQSRWGSWWLWLILIPYVV